MLFTVSVKKLVYKVIWLLPFFLFVFYQIYIYTLWDDNGRTAIIEKHKYTTAHYKKLDALVLGGSNSAFSISAELLSLRTGKSWYNASLLNEGFSDSNYQKFVNSLFSLHVKQQIKTIVYSSVSYFKEDEIKLRAAYWGPIEGHPAISLKPQRSMLAYSRSVLAGEENFERKIYPIPNEFGDFQFDFFDCGKISVREFEFNKAELQLAVEVVLKNILAYFDIFPNANLYFVFPSDYYKNYNKNLIDAYNISLSKLLVQTLSNQRPNVVQRLYFLNQSSYPSPDLLCDAHHHANKYGRAWRTEDLAVQLKSSSGF